MGRLDQNLDAYRLAADILERLRNLVRRHMETAHGPSWETDGIPAETHEFLLQRRQREASVKWNPASGSDLLDYAGFADLHDVLAAHPRLRDSFSRLVPEPQALRLRFLELDSVLNRIGFARPVTESDMELLLGFDERLRPLTNELADPTEPPAVQAAPPKPAKEPHSPRHTKPAEERPAAAPAPPPPRTETAPAAPPPGSAEPREHPSRAPAAARATEPAAPATGERETGRRVTVTKEFEAALREGDDIAILTALYQEITGIAEKIWGDTATGHSPIWEVVRESQWYRNRFSSLRLKVVSDFFDLARTVQEKAAAGSTRTELHEFLKDRNFAQLLMDLRELFRPLQTAARPAGPTSTR